MKDLISVKDLSVEQIQELLKLTDEIKRDKTRFTAALSGKTLALIFQKPSNRTRVSFEVGMYQLGGYSIYLGPNEISLGVRESISDVAKTLSRYVDGIVLRTFEHKNVTDLAKFASVPVINGLSDLTHPCQALADIYTIREKKENLKGMTLAYIGDGNNVCNSLLYACAKVGMNMNIAAPKGYEPDKHVLDEAKRMAQSGGSEINLSGKPREAVRGADVIYTDVWTSMGQEKEAKARKKAFKGFQVNKTLVNLAGKGVLVMHCLPAHRGEEIADDIMESKNSVIFDQAENRMHVQKAILIKLLS
ncbi:MAG: ornithine carbamoyltransferase [Candidatus Omnitrophica bacterium]|nr:ornithine carbamoyltransferase [Candidatus Omnitrophota bacterium]MDD5553668.1 ornithine carbamoyltransferase [Candidatus Omnitrophota bacterium]